MFATYIVIITSPSYYYNIYLVHVCMVHAVSHMFNLYERVKYRIKCMWPLKAALLSTKLLSKHAVHVSTCLVLIHKWVADSSLKIFYGYH